MIWPANGIFNFNGFIRHCVVAAVKTSHRRHCVSDHRKLNSLFNSLTRFNTKHTLNLYKLLAIHEGNPLVHSGISLQENTNAESASMWWRHTEKSPRATLRNLGASLWDLVAVWAPGSRGFLFWCIWLKLWFPQNSRNWHRPYFGSYLFDKWGFN